MSTKNEPTWLHTNNVLHALTSELQCVICEKLPINPHLLWCKHSFCKECIITKPKCPKCDYTVTPQELMPDIMISRLLDAMKVVSSVSKRGETLTRDEETQIAPKQNLPAFKSNNAELNKCDTKNSQTSKLLTKNTCDGKIIKQTEHTVTSTNRLRMKTPKRALKGLSPSTNMDDSSVSTITSRKKVSNVRLNLANTKEGSDKRSTPKIKPQSKSFSPNTTILFSAKKSQQTSKVNVKGETLLQIACRQGRLAKVQQLLREGAEPNVKDYANWTPLCDAVGSGNIEVVRALLEAGAGVNTPSHLNTTPLVEAVVKNDKAMILLLMSYGADMHQRTALNNTAISIASDEMKSIMLAAKKVNIQPNPRTQTAPRTITASKLPQDHIDKMMRLCQMFNLTLSTTFTEETSHIVVEKTTENSCHGSVDVMLGLLAGCGVVGMDWVTASLEAEELLSVNGFEPSGTNDFPNTNAFQRARLNKEHLLPRLFDGSHISLQQDQVWPPQHKRDIMALVQTSGAQYLPRQCDPERIPPAEDTVMFHTTPQSCLGLTSHIVLYQPGPAEPLLKYNMAHIKSLSVSWFLQCIKTFSIS